MTVNVSISKSAFDLDPAKHLAVALLMDTGQSDEGKLNGNNGDGSTKGRGKKSSQSLGNFAGASRIPKPIKIAQG